MRPQGRINGPNEEHRRIVLLMLAKGPETGVTLTHDLAARCGSKANVSDAIHRLKEQGFIRGEHRSRQVVSWHLTQAGITEAMRLIAERQEARAGA